MGRGSISCAQGPIETTADPVRVRGGFSTDRARAASGGVGGLPIPAAQRFSDSVRQIAGSAGV